MLRPLSGILLASLAALPPHATLTGRATPRAAAPGALGIRIAANARGQRPAVVTIDARGGRFRVDANGAWTATARVVPPASLALDDAVSEIHIRTDAQSPIEMTIVRGDSAIAPAGASPPSEPLLHNGAPAQRPSPAIWARDIRLQRAGDTFRIVSTMLPADKASPR